MENLVSEGLSLMMFGMGFVFTFLTLLVGMTTLMSKLVTKFEPVPVAAPVKAKRSPSASVEKSDDELVAVITAAVHKFRS